MLPHISPNAACRLIDVVERNRRRILDQMLQNARDAMHKRSLALNLLAGTFLDRFVDSLSAGDPQRLLSWIGTLSEAGNDSPNCRQIFAAGCATIAAEYRTAGCEGADVLAYFAGVSLEIERAISAAVKPPAQPLPEAQLREEAIAAVFSVLESHDGATAQHGRAVGAWSGRIARGMNFNKENVEFIERCGLLHDIGKFSIPLPILNKPGKLDDAEWAMVKAHAATGAEVLARIPSLRDCAAVVRSHHEWYDGSGYPDQLKGAQIPIPARIIAVADAYDAMVARRVYRPSASPAQALATLLGGAGTQWDPAVVDAFAALFGSQRRANLHVRSA